jgi:hypothetical protein
MVIQGQRAPGMVALMVVAIFAWLVAASAAQAPTKGRNSAATITGAFADSCRDFAAHSTKDISYVELHYVAGPVIRDESINSPDHVIDGGPGDEIAFATVKSGTTIEEFACMPGNRAPTARLEIQTPPIDATMEHCYLFIIGGSSDDGLVCEWSSPRTVWTSASEIPANRVGRSTSATARPRAGVGAPLRRSELGTRIRLVPPATTAAAPLCA